MHKSVNAEERPAPYLIKLLNLVLSFSDKSGFSQCSPHPSTPGYQILLSSVGTSGYLHLADDELNFKS